MTLLLGSLWLVSCTEPAGPRLENGGDFIAVSTGGSHTCAVTRTGAAYCWGSDVQSQLGNRGRGNSATPVKVESAVPFLSVSAGLDHTCALADGGELYCWGRNDAGQLGNGSTVSQSVPTVLGTSLRFVSFTSGGRHTCGLTAAGQAYCWGAGADGQLGTGRVQGELAPAVVAGNLRWASLSAGTQHTCGVTTDGAAYCWGANSWGQLGNGTVNAANQPMAVLRGLGYQTISAGETHSCAIDRTNVAFCWGSNQHGEVGNFPIVPDEPAELEPAQVYNILRYTTISAGHGFSCAVDLTGLGLCWGRGVEGQLGTGQILDWPNPEIVHDGQLWITPWKFVHIAATGRTHACGLTDASSIYCWGRGEVGQLGNTTTSFAPLATRIRTR